MSAALLAFVLGAVAHADDFSRVDVGDVVALEMEWRDRKKRRRETHVRLPAQDVALAEGHGPSGPHGGGRACHGPRSGGRVPQAVGCGCRRRGHGRWWDALRGGGRGLRAGGVRPCVGAGPWRAHLRRGTPVPWLPHAGGGHRRARLPGCCRGRCTPPRCPGSIPRAAKGPACLHEPGAGLRAVHSVRETSPGEDAWRPPWPCSR